MNMHKDARSLSGRRNFMLATFLCPFLAGKLMEGSKIGEINPLFSNREEFIVLDGWVLLQDDLAGTPGQLS
ncbi:MAG: hypothetical protein HZC43_06005 [Nitrosomonadales bacterium]|nr:hypothetical protein [Nitrosomonadales bacterium]